MKKICLLVCMFILVGCTNKPVDDIVDNVTITFDENGGSDVRDITIKKDTLTLLPTPTKEGFIFDSWIDKDLNVYKGELSFSNDISLTAVWILDSTNITISFDEKGGSDVLNIIVEKNTKVTLPIPTKLGFTFVNWVDQEGNIYPMETNFSKDTTLIARWELSKFEVKFVDYDDTVLSTQTIFYNQSATAPLVPNRLNYVFNKWDKSFSKVTSSVTIKAIYEEATDGLVFDLTDIGYMVIDYIGESKEVVIPNYINGILVNEIGPNAFEASTITQVKFSNNIIKIHDYAFFGATLLTSLDLPSSLIEIGFKAFAECTNLTSVTIPAQIIGEYAFFECANITDIVLLDSVKTIKAYAFYNNSDLVNLTIPSSVTTIERDIFSWCQKLTNIYTENSNVTRLQEMINTAGYIYAKNAKVVGK